MKAKTDRTFADKISVMWMEMRDAVRNAVKTYGRMAVKKLAEDDGCIFLDGNKIEFRGTENEVATAVDSLLERLREADALIELLQRKGIAAPTKLWKPGRPSPS